jgi:DNA-binding Xre family transcriptional regulator
VSAQEGVKFLPTEELIEVLGSKNSADLFIGGVIMLSRSTVLLYRGNLESLEIPLSWFVARPGGIEPDPKDFSISDYGQAIRLGHYEASTDAALYEFDEKYRVRTKKRLAAEDSSIGGAIRRLRLQKGLRQSDFPGVTAKEIARIENGKVKKPHRQTLEKIAKRTGVAVEQLITF